MPLGRYELIEGFGAASDVGSAALFLGAGLSKAAHLPEWSDLLEVPRRESGVPVMQDLPLMAEYILVEGHYTRARLEQHILDSVLAAGAGPTASHEWLARLPVDQIWTTNYDPLVERSNRDAPVIAVDEDIRLIGTSRKAIIKMHGSIDPDGATPVWTAPPVITRTDFEMYEERHRRTWALLRASYLSKTFLFLGFSFADPNIEVLHRLARRHGTAVHDRHMTVMRRPSASNVDDRRQHDLRVRDLESSGVRVHEIDSQDELPDLLKALVRRTRRPRLFLSGSDRGGAFDVCCHEVAGVLADRIRWEMHSLGGDAGWRTTREIARIRRAENTYNASALVFHSRRKVGPPPPTMDERVGTAVFTDLDRQPLVQGLLDESRAVLVLGGGDRTKEEIEWALGYGAGVVPFAASGGAAHTYWETCGTAPSHLGGQPTDPTVWGRLDGDPDVAARAAMQLLEQVMYSTGRP